MLISASSDKHYAENDIWHLLKNGSREAVNLLVYRYYDDLLRYGSSFCNNTLLVEDMIQDLFCELCQKPEGISHINFIKPYLFTSLRRRIFRQMSRDRKVLQIDTADADGLRFEVEFSPEELMVRKEEKAKLAYAITEYIQRLSPRQRESIYLRFYENLSYEAISGIMDISVPYLYLLVHKSLTRIRKLLNGKDIKI